MGRHFLDNWIMERYFGQVAFFSMGVCTMLMTVAPLVVGYQYQVPLIVNILCKCVSHIFSFIPDTAGDLQHHGPF